MKFIPLLLLGLALFSMVMTRRKNTPRPKRQDKPPRTDSDIFEDMETCLQYLDHPDYEMRAKAVERLIGGSAEVVPVLAQVLQNGSSRAREMAAEALGRLGDARAVPPLLAAIQDESAWTRLAIVRALGQIGDARAYEPLKALLQDGDSDVRLAAQEALTRLTI